MHFSWRFVPSFLQPNSFFFLYSQASIKKIDSEDIEIDVDSIDSATFWIIDAFVKDCLPGGKKATKRKMTSTIGTSDVSKSKRARQITSGYAVAN